MCLGTYDEAQIKVFNLIANILNDMDVSKVSLTEKITKNVIILVVWLNFKFFLGLRPLHGECQSDRGRQIADHLRSNKK